VRDQLSDRNIRLQPSDEARAFLAKEGFDPEYGARPLRRSIQRLVENPIARGILQGEFGDGGTVIIEVEDGKLVHRLLPITERREVAELDQ